METLLVELNNEIMNAVQVIKGTSINLIILFPLYTHRNLSNEHKDLQDIILIKKKQFFHVYTFLPKFIIL